MKKSESRAEAWTSSEPMDSYNDKRRINAGRKLESEGYSFLADPTGIDNIGEPVQVITPSSMVITPDEIVIYEHNRLDLSELEKKEMEGARDFYLNWEPRFFN